MTIPTMKLETSSKVWRWWMTPAKGPSEWAPTSVKSWWRMRSSAKLFSRALSFTANRFRSRRKKNWRKTCAPPSTRNPSNCDLELIPVFILYSVILKILWYRRYCDTVILMILIPSYWWHFVFVACDFSYIFGFQLRKIKMMCVSQNLIIIAASLKKGCSATSGI